MEIGFLFHVKQPSKPFMNIVIANSGYIVSCRIHNIHNSFAFGGMSDSFTTGKNVASAYGQYEIAIGFQLVSSRFHIRFYIYMAMDIVCMNKNDLFCVAGKTVQVLLSRFHAVFKCLLIKINRPGKILLRAVSFFCQMC